MDYNEFAKASYHRHIEELEYYGVGLIKYEEYLKVNSKELTEKWKEYIKYLNECG